MLSGLRAACDAKAQDLVGFVMVSGGCYMVSDAEHTQAEAMGAGSDLRIEPS